MISINEILKNTNFDSLPKEHRDNITVLLERINSIRSAWSKPMLVTSGYRSMEDHIRIYKELAAQRKQIFDQSKIPMASKHLIGAAVDISDPDGKLFDWTKSNTKLLESVGLWCEEKDDQARVHYQIFPPKSGKRFFIA